VLYKLCKPVFGARSTREETRVHPLNTLYLLSTVIVFYDRIWKPHLS